MLTDETLIPRHLLINSVLSYLDLYSVFKFSYTSKVCQKVVYQEIPKTRWRVINLSGSQITDDQLCAFLKHINAKENTSSLSLVGCVNIHGPGLTPLHGSMVMEDIDLRVCGSLPLLGEHGKFHGPSGLMEECISQMLFSMLPLQRDLKEGRKQLALRRVAIRPEFQIISRRFHNHSDVFRRFFQYHHSLKRFLPPMDPQRCTSKICRLCYVEPYKTDAVTCTVCLKHYCIACAMPPTCSECAKQKCQWCSNVMECGGCNKQSCASHGYECCGGCDKAFCQDCHEDELEFCVVCNEYYCTDECHRRAHR